MAEWGSEVRRLKKGHGWKSKPGYKIFVADAGAVRFDYPGDWLVEIDEAGTIKFRDRQSPDDTCVLQVTVMRLVGGEIDWTGLPLTEMFWAAVKGEERQEPSYGELFEIQRPDLEAVWTETRSIDPNERREAISRICLARGSNIFPLITLDFWPEDLERLDPVWHELLRTLRLGEYIFDPTRGPKGRKPKL